jgi:uncharacterized membrane protein (UPF0127 family)
MPARSPVSRLHGLPLTTVLGREVPVAAGFRARLLGLAHLDRDVAGPGLLIPHCSSIHTFGMRFALDIYFLDEEGAILTVRPFIAPSCLVLDRRASAVLEIPAAEGGEFSPLGT